MADRETDLAWLAGIVDGEGSVTLERSGEALTARVQVMMGHEATISRICEVLEDRSIRFLRPGFPNRGASTQMHVVRVGRIVDVGRLTGELTPFATTKLEHLGLLREWCESRLLVVRGAADGKAFGRGNPYTPRERAIYEELRFLNRRGGSCMEVAT